MRLVEGQRHETCRVALRRNAREILRRGLGLITAMRFIRPLERCDRQLYKMLAVELMID